MPLAEFSLVKSQPATGNWTHQATVTELSARSPSHFSFVITVGDTRDADGVGTIVAGEIKAQRI